MAAIHEEKRGGRILRVAFALTRAAGSGLVAWDRQRQRHIVERAASLEEGVSALLAHRVRRDRIAERIARAYAMIGVAISPDPASALDGIERLPDGSYRLEFDSHISTGTEGEVWRASDKKLCRVVAAKFVRPELAAGAR